jgi:hypothetical protein
MQRIPNIMTDQSILIPNTILFKKIIVHDQIFLKHISTHEMAADLFTKPLLRDIFLMHVRGL